VCKCHRVTLLQLRNISYLTRAFRFKNTIFIHYTIHFLLFHGTTAPGGPGPPHNRGFMIILRHTTLGRTPLEDQRRDPYLTAHNIHKRQPNPRRDSNPQSREESGRRPTLFIINTDLKVNTRNNSLLIHTYKISANKQRDCITTPLHYITAVPKLCTEKPTDFAVGCRMIRRFLLGLDSSSGPKSPHF
jgi:hypothetical protein